MGFSGRAFFFQTVLAAALTAKSIAAPFIRVFLAIAVKIPPLLSVEKSCGSLIEKPELASGGSLRAPTPQLDDNAGGRG
ncbi:hypothetical protein [Mesorhizobium sp. M0478]|uniref:hypothetical protein n=1 Tax=Mesorhizobium sp. M0478 TaxID=2956947 RepID=UPI00333C8089